MALVTENGVTVRMWFFFGHELDFESLFVTYHCGHLLISCGYRFGLSPNHYDDRSSPANGRGGHVIIAVMVRWLVVRTWKVAEGQRPGEACGPREIGWSQLHHASASPNTPNVHVFYSPPKHVLVREIRDGQCPMADTNVAYAYTEYLDRKIMTQTTQSYLFKETDQTDHYIG